MFSLLFSSTKTFNSLLIYSYNINKGVKMGLFTSTKKKDSQLDNVPKLDAPPPLRPEDLLVNEDFSMPETPSFKGNSLDIPNIGQIPEIEHEDDAPSFPLPPNADELEKSSEEEDTIFDGSHETPTFPELPDENVIHTEEQIEKPISISYQKNQQGNQQRTFQEQQYMKPKFVFHQDQDDEPSLFPKPAENKIEPNIASESRDDFDLFTNEKIPIKPAFASIEKQTIPEKPPMPFELHRNLSYITIAQYRKSIIANNELKHKLDTTHDTLFRMMQLHNDKDLLFQIFQQSLESLHQRMSAVDDILFKLR